MNARPSTPWLPLTGLFAAAGGLVGFLLRPATVFGNQLPFSVVITRGADLHGLNRLLIPLAQRSFNDLAAGLVVGAIAGYLIAVLARR